jgi:hypothetical protein
MCELPPKNSKLSSILCRRVHTIVHMFYIQTARMICDSYFYKNSLNIA